jgi:hypothetical protein
MSENDNNNVSGTLEMQVIRANKIHLFKKMPKNNPATTSDN